MKNSKMIYCLAITTKEARMDGDLRHPLLKNQLTCVVYSFVNRSRNFCRICKVRTIFTSLTFYCYLNAITVAADSNII